jgi:hypothetical protein
MNNNPVIVVSICALAILVGFTGVVSAEDELFPPGDYVTHCRALGIQLDWGGDDDHNQIYYVEVDTAFADGDPDPDFFIFLWDGDNNAGDDLGCGSGIADCNPYSHPGSNSVFEYRLFGGPGASVNDDTIPGADPVSWSGTLIDIDSDSGDSTLNTHDPDDLEGKIEDLKDGDYSIISVDMDADPGDLIGSNYVYKFVVDGSSGPSDDFNRYEVQVSTTPDSILVGQLALYTYELTYAGAPESGQQFTSFEFWVGSLQHQMDIQTLDLDGCSPGAEGSEVRIIQPDGTIHDGLDTYESDEQYDLGGNWM